MRKLILLATAILILPIQTHAQFFGNSANVTSNACATYQGLLKSVKFDHYWKLNEKTGTAAVDTFGTNPGTYLNAPTTNTVGPFKTSAASRNFNGYSQQVSTTLYLTNPQAVTIVVWFKTNTAGGKLIGLGNSQSGSSSAFDRHIFMTTSGQIVFGVWNNAQIAIKSPGSYADGRWHMAVGSFGAAGMKLFVDGVLVGTDPNSVAACCDGYWRIGYDALGTWPDAPANTYFTGILADVATADSKQVSDSQVQELYAIGKRCHTNASGPVISLTSASYGAGAQTCDASVYARAVCSGLNTCTLRSSNLICGDSAFGTPKQLAVDYRCGSTPKTAAFSENTDGHLDCP